MTEFPEQATYYLLAVFCITTAFALCIIVGINARKIRNAKNKKFSFTALAIICLAILASIFFFAGKPGEDPWTRVLLMSVGLFFYLGGVPFYPTIFQAGKLERSLWKNEYIVSIVFTIFLTVLSVIIIDVSLTL
jgi:peptidoglycan/LPS O-acetylase OafA/YrhL